MWVIGGGDKLRSAAEGREKVCVLGNGCYFDVVGWMRDAFPRLTSHITGSWPEGESDRGVTISSGAEERAI